MGGLFNVIYMSSIISLHYATVLSISTLYPEIADQKKFYNIGQLSVIIMFGFEMLFNIIAQTYIKKFKYRIAFFIQAIMSSMVFLPAILIIECEDCQYFIISLATIVGFSTSGAGLGGYWVLSSLYTSENSNDDNKEQYFGYSFCIVGGSFLLSSFLSDQLLNYFSRTEFFMIMFGIQLFASFAMLFIRDPLKKQNYEKVIVSESSLIGTSDSEQQFNQQSFNDLTFNEKLEFIYQTGTESNALHANVLFLLTGVVTGFEFGQFYEVITQTLDQSQDEVIINQKTLKVFILLGIGQMSSGPLLNIINKKLNLFSYFHIYTNLLMITLTLTLINAYIKSYTLCFFLGFLWGYLDNNGQSLCLILISKHWGDNICMYGLFFGIQNIGIIMYNLLEIVLPREALFYMMAYVLILQMIGNLVSHKLQRKLS